MTVAMARQEYVVCPKCGQKLARWDDDAEDWEPLGARVRRRRDMEHGRPSFVCPVCGAMKRIPDGDRSVANRGSAA